MEDALLLRAVRAMLNPALHPILVHCLSGEHMTACVVGCLRRTQGWALSAVAEEYRLFVQSKPRLLDLQVIELFPVDRATAKGAV